MVWLVWVLIAAVFSGACFCSIASHSSGIVLERCQWCRHTAGRNAGIAASLVAQGDGAGRTAVVVLKPVVEI